MSSFYHFAAMGDSFARVRVGVFAHQPARKDRPMAVNFYPTRSSFSAKAVRGGVDLEPATKERIATMAAVVLAVLVVAAIAVLIGMA
jgi:hypothetical protein